MTKQEEAIAAAPLVGGGETTLHSHAGGGGFTYTAVNPPAETNVGGSLSTWLDWDLSSVIPSGARYAVIYMRASQTTAYAGMVRKKGDTFVTNTISLRYYAPISMIVELDSSRVCQRYATSAGIFFSVLGYIT